MINLKLIHVKMNKKAELDELVKNILWIIFFIIAIFGIGYLIKRILSG